MLVISVLAGVATSLHADWFDDFSDGSIDDGSPVTWSTNPLGAFPGEYTVDPGSIGFVPLNGELDDEVMLAWAESETFESLASVRTRARVLTEPEEIFTGSGNVGPLMFFNPDLLTGYFGVLDASGGLFLFSADGGGEATELATTALEFDATEEVFVQLDHDGDAVALSAWRVGDEQPEPQIVFEDSTHTFGVSGVIFAEDGLMDAGFFYEVRAATERIVDGEEIRGDFNGDSLINGLDIDALMNEVAAGSNDGTFDLNADGAVDNDDRDAWLEVAGPANGFAGALHVGDSNLDGTIDAADLNATALNWQTDNADWTKGNYSGARTDAGDLNAMALNWQKSVPAAAAAASAVPEPSAATTLLLLTGIAVSCRRRK